MIKNLQKKISCLFVFCAWAWTAEAQFHIPVLSGMEGQSLLDQLVIQYKPASVLDSNQSRDTLFARVYMRNDSLSCVYSGHIIYLNPNQDPTMAAFQNGASSGINTEHTFPQAFGAGSGNAQSDMHHLYPTRTPVNADRGNLPFAEVPDNQTIEWYYLNQSQSFIPNQNIVAYSERGANTFEPREDHKGNVARAMFYFYTMYKAAADAEDPNFFNSQKETLCDWHLLDPVDQKEWERNAIIASYQSGKKNPFILDCTLAERSYCAEFNQSCSPTSGTSSANHNSLFELLQNKPNPVFDNTEISYRLEQAFDVRLSLYDASGRLCKTIVEDFQQRGNYTVVLEDTVLVQGMLYIYRLELFDGANYYASSRKLLKL
jgi:endonuclease I